VFPLQWNPVLRTTIGRGRKRRGATSEESTLVEGFDRVDDNHPTPQVFQSPLKIDYPCYKFPHPGQEVSEYSSEIGITQSQRSNKKSRSSSPKKATLQHGFDQFTFEDFSSANANTFPRELQRMKTDIEDFRDGFGILPSELKVFRGHISPCATTLTERIRLQSLLTPFSFHSWRLSLGVITYTTAQVVGKDLVDPSRSSKH